MPRWSIPNLIREWNSLQVLTNLSLQSMSYFLPVVHHTLTERLHRLPTHPQGGRMPHQAVCWVHREGRAHQGTWWPAQCPGAAPVPCLWCLKHAGCRCRRGILKYLPNTHHIVMQNIFTVPHSKNIKSSATVLYNICDKWYDQLNSFKVLVASFLGFAFYHNDVTLCFTYLFLMNAYLQILTPDRAGQAYGQQKFIQSYIKNSQRH